MKSFTLMRWIGAGACGVIGVVMAGVVMGIGLKSGAGKWENAMME